MEEYLYFTALSLIFISCSEMSGSNERAPFEEQETGPGLLLNEDSKKEADATTSGATNSAI
ncbi:MAG: hypothetical protein ACI865_000668 [Flavobacteriaceae bacterium]|jgi:hypothetical protein